MKKYIVSSVIVLGILVSPAFTQAAALTTNQANSLIAVIQSAPGVPASAFVNLITAFSNITINQATSLVAVVQSAPNVPASAFVNLLISFASGDTSATQPMTPTTNQAVTPTQPTIATASLPSGTVGNSYSISISGNSGSSVYDQNHGYAWSISGLPPGLTNSLPAGAVGTCQYGCSGTSISGTPTIAGTYTVTATLNSGSQTVSKQFSLGIVTAGTTPPSACGPTVYLDAASMAVAETKAGIKRGIAMGGFAFDGTNNIWVPITDLGGIGTNGFDSVMKITPSGDITVYTGTGIQPEGIGFDGTNIWTANGYSSVTKITPSGVMTTYRGGVQPNGIASDGTNVWVSDSGIASGGSSTPGSVIKITPSGAMTTYIIGEDSHPASIAFDGTNMWTSNGTGVSKITPSGVVTTYSSEGAFSPRAIAFDGTNMWTANASAGPGGGVNGVTKITPSGAMTMYPGGRTQNKLSNPSSIAFDGTNMWTGNGDSITKITPSGAMTTYPLGAIGFGVIAGGITATSNIGKILFDGTDMWFLSSGGVKKINLSSACLPQSPALPAITNTSIPNGTFGSPYTVSLGSNEAQITFDQFKTVGIGTGLYRIWAVTGLPAGLSLNGVSYGAISGLQDTMYPGSGAPPTISGTPSAIGTYNVTVTLTTTSNYVSGCYSDGSCSDPIYQTVSKHFTLVIAPSSTYSSCGPTVVKTYSGLSNAPESSGARGYDVNTLINAIAFDGTNMWTANNNWENLLEEQQHGLSIVDSVTKITPSGIATIYEGTGINPVGIAFDGTNMWTANSDSLPGIPSSGGSVTKITPSGTMTTYTGVGKYPVDIAFDGTNMWTENDQDNSVTKITPSGAMTTYALTPGSSANGYKSGIGVITFDGTNTWVIGSLGATKITPSGAMTMYEASNGKAFDGTNIAWTGGSRTLAFDGTNMWRITGNGMANNGVTKITPSGAMTTYAVTGYPAKIAFDGTNMWTFNLDGSMTKITSSGTVTTYAGMIIGGLGANAGIGAAFDGTNMWVAQNGKLFIGDSNNKVTKVNIVGTCSTPPPSSTTQTITTTSYSCARCSMTNNYTRATFDSDSSDCNSTTAHNTNVVYSCDSSCGIAPGINGVGANTTYDSCGPLSLIGGANQTASALNAFNSASQTQTQTQTQSPAQSPTSFTYVWNRDLQIGSPYFADVSALQTALTKEGVYTGEITGGFYDQTFTAVKAFQQKYAIETTGYVGAITRVKLNVLY